MPRLADETLIAAHETILDRWKKTKPEQYSKLHESVRQDPAYRPFRPSKVETDFYREREEYLASLPRYELRAVYDPLYETRHASTEIAVVEDRKRMSVYRAPITSIQRGTVDWPSDVLEFARDEIRDRSTERASAEDEPGNESSTEDEFLKYLFELFPLDVVERAAVCERVNRCDVYHALDELQGILASELPYLVREYEVEKFGDRYVVLSAHDDLINDLLLGYDDNVVGAVVLAHGISADAPIPADEQLLLVGGSEETIRRARETLEPDPDAELEPDPDAELAN
jgi:hypothetical protein